jgi:signal transduction histidine kinase
VVPLLKRAAEEWQSYDATPQFPGEREPRDQALAQVARLNGILNAIAEASTRGDSTKALRLINDMAPSAFQGASDGLMELLLYNQRSGHSAALQAEQARRAAALAGWGLGGVAALLTLLLAAMVVSSMRRLDRVTAERDTMLQQRATEHEIFASRVVHDIRGPLTVAQLWIDRGRREKTDAARAEALERVATGLRRTVQIVEDLYSLARANIAHRGQTSLREAVDYAVDEIAPRAAGAGIEVKSEAIPEVVVAAAPGIVASVLSNLLSNAVNYAGRGAKVTVRALAGERVRVGIADTGHGIPLDVQSRIFEPYVRGDGQEVASGLGLGLATVKQLVERSGGACGVESSPGVGSLFWFELPTVTTASRPAPA